MKRRDIWLLAGVLIIAAAVFLLAKVLPQGSGGISGVQLPVVTQTPAASGAASTAAPSDETASAGPAMTLPPADAYLSVQVDNVVFVPFPLTESRDIELPQPDGKLNVARVTEGSVQMHSSTCENQDCVLQGIVTLDNRDARVLGNAIVCLPNKVVLMLLTPEEAQREWDRYIAQAGE